MTIQEAIASGKMFKRPDWKLWAKVVENRLKVAYQSGNCVVMTITVDDILATDYISRPMDLVVANEP